MTAQNLPKTESEFFEALRLYFPNVYDVKYLMKSCKNLKGGLQEVANELEVPRIGPQHQAGSDSLLTGQTFFKMKEMFFEDDIDDSKYCGHLYGLGTNFVVPSTTASSMTTSASTPAMGANSDSTSGTGTDGNEAGHATHAATTAKLETVPDEPEPAASSTAASGGLTMAIDKDDKEKSSEDGDVKMADVSESGSGQQKEGSANKDGDSADESAGGEVADKTASGENTQEDQASA